MSRMTEVLVVLQRVWDFSRNEAVCLSGTENLIPFIQLHECCFQGSPSLLVGAGVQNLRLGESTCDLRISAVLQGFAS